jgi:hypothetical protein
MTGFRTIISALVITVALTAPTIFASSEAAAFNNTIHPIVSPRGSSASTGTHSKHVTPPRVQVCHQTPSGRQYCVYLPGGTTQPACKGPHKGPNGVMIQCD